jgi:hypothetical protein
MVVVAASLLCSCLSVVTRLKTSAAAISLSDEHMCRRCCGVLVGFVFTLHVLRQLQKQDETAWVGALEVSFGCRCYPSLGSAAGVPWQGSSGFSCGTVTQLPLCTPPLH